jgi:hypothetical protein
MLNWQVLLTPVSIDPPDWLMSLDEAVVVRVPPPQALELESEIDKPAGCVSVKATPVNIGESRQCYPDQVRGCA